MIPTLRPVPTFGALALLALTAFARPAAAQVMTDANQLDGKLPDWVDPNYVKPQPAPPTVVPPGRVWVPPVYRRVYVPYWCGPVYRPVVRRIWHAPVTRTTCERVWVPARYEWRETVTWENGVRVVRREYVCAQPAHWEDQTREVVVSPGYWEEFVEQVLVTDGRWDNVERDEVVIDGHWEVR